MWRAIDATTGDTQSNPDSRARQPADALANVDRNITEHPFNANISRSSCLHPLVKNHRHHPQNMEFSF
jgi:hypothetical protein